MGATGVHGLHYVYKACCAEEELYTGPTPNSDRWVAARNSKVGARHTRPCRSITVAANWSFNTRAEELQGDRAIKGLARLRKLALATASREETGR
jgi:predicted GIY-YIG superfamily endonuclease